MTRARTLATALRDRFAGQGAQVVEPPILLPADVLLDLYGEDIRARAYTTGDPVRGEQMLRPDFTVPVVQMHLRGDDPAARYTYAGEVFRRQDDVPDRANEYLQVGYEVFDIANPAQAEAEVFASLSETVAHLSLRAATGDIGILIAAVEGLHTSDQRKAALRRHIWRPRRFRALFDRFAGRTPVPPSRAALLHQDAISDAPLIGKRTSDEITARIADLRADAAEPPLSKSEAAAFDRLFAVRGSLPDAARQLGELARDLPSITEAVAALQARIVALATRGVAVDTLEFELTYGRTSMEYYDGFVFGLYAAAHPDLPPVVTGGRYNALTRQLGNGNAAPAVGGVIRPDLVALLEGDA
ncbi:MAG: ATP phosphoribosyltransferase regulatory subunit [Pseudomonadota bacterium]